MSTWDDPKATWGDAAVAWDGEALAPARAPFFVIPDAERVVVDFLRDQPELAGPLAGRIYTALPAQPDWPAVRVTRWGGWAAIWRPLWLDEAWCQVDVWGGTKAEASELARLMRALVGYRLVAEAAGTVTAVRFGMLHDAPDTTYQPAKPHFRFDLSVMLHPGPDALVPATRAPDALARSNP